MQLFSHGTAVPPQSHVDLDDIRSVLREHPEALVECAMATSVYFNPEQRGMRSLERSANTAFHCVLETLSPEDWGLSPFGLIQTIERGRSWDSEGREVALYRLAPKSVRQGVTKHLDNKDPQGLEGMKGSKGLEGLKDGDTFAHRFSIPEVRALLDPALDIWSRGKTQLGKEGWRIAMLTGLETLEMSAKEWAELAGGTDRAKRLAKKLLAYGWGILTKTGKARATRYTLDWSQLLSEQAAEMFLLNQRTREGRLLVEHGQEQIRITQPLSAEEVRAKKGEEIATALLAELDGTEMPEYRADIERLAEVYRRATADDWTRWMERA